MEIRGRDRGVVIIRRYRHFTELKTGWHLQIERPVLGGTDEKRGTPRHSLLKCLNSKGPEELVYASRQKGPLIYKGHRID